MQRALPRRVDPQLPRPMLLGVRQVQHRFLRPQRHVHIVWAGLAAQRQHHGMRQDSGRNYRLAFAVGACATCFFFGWYLLHNLHDMRFHPVKLDVIGINW
jgi:hypothetical protein